MKNAFTMIELIFVIVIIGILASIAIPKFLATRNDAQTAALATQIKEGTKELISYYVSQGGEVNFSQITNNKTSQIVLNELIHRGWAKVIDDNHSVFYSDKNSKTVCINYYTNGLKIKVETNSSDNSTLCNDIKRIIRDRNYTVFGNSIKY